jgi:hypothetical protein
MLQVTPPFQYFTESDGSPLEAGKIYVGTVNLNPITNPVTVYWDADGLIPADQPIRTIGGFPSRNGSPSKLFVPSDYSILVRDRNDVLMYSDLNAFGELDAAQIPYTPPGTNAIVTNVETVLRRKVYSQDYPTYQDAINAGDIIEFPAGTLPISAQFTVPAGKELIIRGVFTPTVNAATPGTAMILITGDNVTIKWKHKAGADGLNSTFSNWAVVSARTTVALYDVQMFGGRFRNIAIDSNLGYVTDFSAVQGGGKIIGGDYKNCGVINNVVGGGFAIYSDFCTGLEVSGNTIDRCGSSGINSSAGLGNKIYGNTLSRITLFSAKAGFATGIVVSNDIAPTTSQFSVTKNALNVKALRVGLDFCIPRTVSFPPPQGKIRSIVDNGTYLTINLAQPSPALMVVGEGVQPLDTGTHIFANSFTFSGDNHIDANGMADFHVYNNHFYFGGHFTDAGVFAGLADAVWAGYDPQGPLQSMNNRGVYVYDNWIYNTKGCSVEVFSSNNVKLKRNECHSYNEGIDPASVTPVAGGVSFGRLGFNRNTDVDICDNTCISDFGFGILHGNFSGGKCTGNTVNSRVGIRQDSPQNCTLAFNDAISKAAGGYTYLIQDPSGTNPGASLRAYKNSGYAIGSGGHVFRNTDAAFFDMNIADDNRWSAANSSTELFVNLSTTATFEAPVSGLFGNVNRQPIRYQNIAPGATVELGQYSADAGRESAGCIFEGFARRGTAAGHYFKGGAFGSVSTLTGYFDSLAANGAGAFVVLGDFTAAPNTPLTGNVTVYYTNNEADPVSLVGVSTVYSGF